MLEALNMQLDPVRTVLTNEVNQITVCVDRKRTSGVFYTVISITASEVRRKVAYLIATTGLFTNNNDFIGSFTSGEALNLVFLYTAESRLTTREAIYATNFERRKEVAESFLLSCAETQISGAVGMLLLEDQNINLGSSGKVYFNYFLDFAKLGEDNEQRFLMQVAKLTFGILSRQYELKHEGVLDNYPYELQAFYKKIGLNSFLSIGSIITFVKMLPEKLSEPATGIGRIFRKLSGIIEYFKNNSMNIFIIIIVLATVSYASWQIYTRMSLRSAQAENTTYIGVERIGEVYLGDEED